MSFALALAPAALRAQAIYQSVDAQGHAVYSDQSTLPGAQQYAPDESAQSFPRVLHVCWTNCFTLAGEHGLYGRTDGTDESWTVERFTPEVFILKRHDAPAEWNGYHAEVTYAGLVANDQLTHVTVDGRAVGDIQMAWGSALDTLPGSDVERDRLAQSGSQAPAGGSMPDAGAAPSLSAYDAPPPLPDEEQPQCAVVGNIWTPGYWVWVGRRYYWIVGTWVHPPQPGLLWTPGYWAFGSGAYLFHPGSWGSQVGYYGGINYGYGYFGAGYSGGRWVGTTFVYNTAVSHVNTSIIRSTYREPPVAVAPSKVSYNGGPNGTPMRSSPRQRVVFTEPHLPPPPQQPHLPTPHTAAKPPHVARSRVEHTPRTTAIHPSVAAPSVAHTQPNIRPHPQSDSIGTKPEFHTRSTGLHPTP